MVDPAGAELAHFEALVVRRGLIRSVPDNALYLSDVAANRAWVEDGAVGARFCLTFPEEA